MHGAFSLIFLTTLIGVGQGLFLALFAGQCFVSAGILTAHEPVFFGVGAGIALAFLIAGLVVSSFHLSHPERAWRAATQWHTSWLSREVIVLPTLMVLVFIYSMVHFMKWDVLISSTFPGVPMTLSLLIGFLGCIAAVVLFLCTAMIYAEIKFIREWSSPLTVANYILLGTASGFTLAAALSTSAAPDMVEFYTVMAIILTPLAFLSRGIALLKNGNVPIKSNDYPPVFVKRIKWLFVIMFFLLPIVLLYTGNISGKGEMLVPAFLFQYAGLIAERWVFFTQIEHPQKQFQVMAAG